MFCFLTDDHHLTQLTDSLVFLFCPHRLMYLINNSNFSPPNDVNSPFGQCSNHHHHFQHCNHPLTRSPTNLNHQLNQLNQTNFHHQTNFNPTNFHPTNHQTNLQQNAHPNQNHIRNSASYNCIVSNKPSASGQIPHHSATNLATNSTTSVLCLNCKNHNHSSSVNRLTSTNSLAAAGSTNSIYNRNKLEQSLLEAKLRVAQLKKELQSSKLKSSTQYLNGAVSPAIGQLAASKCGQINGAASNSSINNASEPQDQVDFGSFSTTGSSSRESQIRMLNNYMQEAVESVYGSQSNSRHSSQQQLALPLIKQGLSSSSVSTDSLRNSTSSVHLNACNNTHRNVGQPSGLNQNYHPYLQINHHQCNHQISTSDSCQSITENIYSNQSIINNLNNLKSKSATYINYGASSSNLASSTGTNLAAVSNSVAVADTNISSSNSNVAGRRPSAGRLDNGQLEQSLAQARQQVVNSKQDLNGSNGSNGSEAGDQLEARSAIASSPDGCLPANCENFVIYSNQSAILAQQKQKQLEKSQKIHDQISDHLHYDGKPTDDHLVGSNATAAIDESFNLLSIIDKYYRKNDSTAVEV